MLLAAVLGRDASRRVRRGARLVGLCALLVTLYAKPSVLAAGMEAAHQQLTQQITAVMHRTLDLPAPADLAGTKPSPSE